MQRKLAVANCTLCETVEYRDARIQELETMLSTKQQEVRLVIVSFNPILFSTIMQTSLRLVVDCGSLILILNPDDSFCPPNLIHLRLHYHSPVKPSISKKMTLSEQERIMNQVQEVQQQLQRLELAMDSKESRVRKLEYEIKLMSGTPLPSCPPEFNPLRAQWG